MKVVEILCRPKEPEVIKPVKGDIATAVGVVTGIDYTVMFLSAVNVIVLACESLRGSQVGTLLSATDLTNVKIKPYAVLVLEGK